MGSGAREREAASVLPEPNDVHSLRRRARRRQDARCAHQGGRRRVYMAGHPHPHRAKDIPGTAIEPHRTDFEDGAAGADKLQRHTAHAVLPKRLDHPFRPLERHHVRERIPRPGIRLDLHGRGDAVYRARIPLSWWLPARRKRDPEALLPDVQPRRRRAQMGQAPVYRPKFQDRFRQS